MVTRQVCTRQVSASRDEQSEFPIDSRQDNRRALGSQSAASKGPEALCRQTATAVRVTRLGAGTLDSPDYVTFLSV